MGNRADSNRLFEQWQDRLYQAREHTAERSGREGSLIEVTAQSHLVAGEFPNSAFKARLDFARRLYDGLRDGGSVRIYVSGTARDDVDARGRASLSKAGCEYLEAHGVPSYALFGDEANQMFGKGDGKANPTDGCRVAVRLFEMLGYGHLHCVCQPAQLMGKALAYVSLGYVPLMHSVPCDGTGDDYVKEAFLAVPRLLTEGVEEH